MDRGIECTSALRIRTWEIGTAGTTRRMGSVGRDASYVPSSTPVQTPSWRYYEVRIYVPTYLFCCAPSSPGRRGAVPGFSWQTAVRQSHPTHTDGWVGGLEMQLSGPALATRGFTSGSGVFLCCSIPTDCLKCDCAKEDLIPLVP